MENPIQRIKYVTNTLQILAAELGSVEENLRNLESPQLSLALIAEMQSVYRSYIEDVDRTPAPDALVQAFIFKIRELFGKLVAANTKITDLKNSQSLITALAQEVDSLHQERIGYRVEGLSLETKIRDLLKMLRSATGEQKLLEDRIKNLEKEHKRVQEELFKSAQALLSERKEVDRLSKEVGTLKDRLVLDREDRQRLAEENDKLRSTYLPTANEMDYRAWLQEILAADVDRPTQGMHYSGAVPIFIERYKKLRQFAAWAKRVFTKAQVEGTADINYGLRQLEDFNFDKE